MHMSPPDPEREEFEDAELRAEDRAKRAAERRLCLECNQRGSHANGCPAAEEDDHGES